ncbi:MAG: outer membrane beta-barrel protein [Gammaproteobacteria bacterium]|nr:outer membrane beta-barrel protein [Gammaproteobacteria bacterium]
MKNPRVIAFLLGSSLFSFLLNSASAGETTWFGQKAAGQWFVGAKVSNVQNGQSGFDGDAGNAGIILGYEFAKAIAYRGKSSIELDITTSFDDGSFRPNIGPSGDWDVDTVGVFFAYRTPGTVYFKGKLGLLSSDVEVDVGPANNDQSDTSFAFGAGLGLLLGERGNLELEVTGDSGDNDLTIISLGGFVRF